MPRRVACGECGGSGAAPGGGGGSCPDCGGSGRRGQGRDGRRQFRRGFLVAVGLATVLAASMSALLMIVAFFFIGIGVYAYLSLEDARADIRMHNRDIAGNELAEAVASVVNIIDASASNI
mgnify:CR=1 FL=1